MSGSPENVKNFLKNIKKNIQTKIDEELFILKKMNSKNTILDKEFKKFSNILQKQIFVDYNEMKNYFSLENCLKGIYIICKSIFGVELNPSAVSKEEIWHNSIRKLEVIDDNEGLIGYIYLDLFSRFNKNDSSSTSTISIILYLLKYYYRSRQRV
jgi:intermediate peptidase